MERCCPQSRSRVRRNLGDNNVGRYIHETFGYDVTFVIGRDDRTRYATIDGELRTADAFELAPGLEHLIARARAISPDQPGAVSAYLMLDGVIAIFGASPITPETTEPIAVPLGPRPVLVYAELLDGDGVLNSIAETLRLHNLHVLPPQAASAATLPLTAPDGTKLGGLVAATAARAGAGPGPPAFASARVWPHCGIHLVRSEPCPQGSADDRGGRGALP